MTSGRGLSTVDSVRLISRCTVGVTTSFLVRAVGGARTGGPVNSCTRPGAGSRHTRRRFASGPEGMTKPCTGNKATGARDAHVHSRCLFSSRPIGRGGIRRNQGQINYPDKLSGLPRAGLREKGTAAFTVSSTAFQGNSRPGALRDSCNGHTSSP